MLSAVVGTVRSLFSSRDGGTSEAPAASGADEDPPHSDSPYEGLVYGRPSADDGSATRETRSFSGRVTDLLYGYGLIDDDVYFTYDCVAGGQRPTLGSMVDVEAVRGHGKGGWKATRVCLISDWDLESRSLDSNTAQTSSLVGIVTQVAQDAGLIDDIMPFGPDSLIYGYKPFRGDWVQGEVTYGGPDSQTGARNLRPLRERRFAGTVTHVYPGYGHVDNRIYFSFRVCEGSWRPKKGDSVEGVMMESKQSKGNWRAVSMKPDTRSKRIRSVENAQESPYAQCVIADLTKNQGGVTITDDLKLGPAMLGHSQSTRICIRNAGQTEQILSKCEVCCPTADVKLVFSAVSSSAVCTPDDSASTSAGTSSEAKLPLRLPPQSLAHATLTIKPEQLGMCLCQLNFDFGDFAIRRLSTVTVHDQQVSRMVAEGKALGPGRSARARRRGGRDRDRDDEMEALIFPGVRPTRNFDINVPVKLPQYPVPRDLKDCALKGGDLVRICPQFLESLCMENFSHFFSALLHLEEIQMEEDMREFDLEGVSMRPRSEFLSLEVPGLAEGRPSVLLGDKIIVTHPNRIRYEGFVHEVLGEAVLLKFHPSFHDLYQAEVCSVMFTFSRTSLRRCHQACAFAKNLGSQVLFPNRVEAKLPQVTVTFRCQATSLRRPVRSKKPRVIPKLPPAKGQGTPDSAIRVKTKGVDRAPPGLANGKAPRSCSGNGKVQFAVPRVQDMKMTHVTGTGQRLAEFVNSRLNARQRSAVVRILQGEGRPLPYVIFGPPGTGKTVTVVEAMLQVHIQLPSSRILACTPSNSAADLLTERLHNSGKVNLADLVRLNAFHRSQENIPDSILPYCSDGDNLAAVARRRIIVCTCSTAGSLYQLGLRAGHFSHVFVDEAGQATEPECLVPAGLSVGADGQIILAGDPMQLGPVLSSHKARQYGLGQSYLERLIQRQVYRRDADKYRDHGCYDPLLVTKLVENYRSHPALLELSSQLFYHGELQAKADPALTHSLTAWERLPSKDGNCPLIFHGIVGSDMREGNSPSWFNPAEVVQVIRYVQSLLSLSSPSLQTGDVGIITPYRKQVEKVKLLLASLGIEGIKVGSVEEFQGQERVAMVISTVRSSEDLLTFDLRHHLGFLSNPKRFNVSISRAQALMIIVGNPYVLVKDEHWCALLRYCLEAGAYTGCQSPSLPQVEPQEEALEDRPEPDAPHPRKQEEQAAFLASPDAPDLGGPEVSDVLAERSEDSEQNVCASLMAATSSGAGTVEGPEEEVTRSAWATTKAVPLPDRTDGESGAAGIGQNAGAAEKSPRESDREEALLSEVGRPEELDRWPTGLGAEAEKRTKEALTSEAASLMDQQRQSGPHREDVSDLIEGVPARASLPPFQRVTLTDRSGNCADALVDRGESGMAAASQIDSSGRGSHLSVSVSAAGSLPERLMEEVEAGESSPFIEGPIEEPAVCQEQAVKMELHGRTRDGLLLHSTGQPVTMVRPPQASPQSSSEGSQDRWQPDDLLSGKTTKDRLVEEAVCPAELSEVGSGLVPDEDEENPEIWDEGYGFCHAPPPDAGHCGEAMPGAGSSELAGQGEEAAEVWDDYTWDVGSDKQPAKSCAEPPVDRQNLNARWKDGGRGPSPTLREDCDRAEAEMPAEPGGRLPNVDWEMPPLEDWSRPDSADTEQGDSNSTPSPATSQTLSQEPEPVHRRKMTTVETAAEDGSDETSGRRAGGDQSTPRLPSGRPLGRGRGMLHAALTGGRTPPEPGRKSPGAHSGSLRNPWKVSAPRYESVPLPRYREQPVQPHTPPPPPPWSEGPTGVDRPGDGLDLDTALSVVDTVHMTNTDTPEGSGGYAASGINAEPNGHHLGKEAEDWDQTDEPPHPTFLYKKPASRHRKGGGWRYSSWAGGGGGSGGGWGAPRHYTNEEDFAGEAGQRVAGWNRGCCVGPAGMEQHAGSEGTMDDYDVIIEGNDDGSDTNAFDLP